MPDLQISDLELAANLAEVTEMDPIEAAQRLRKVRQKIDAATLQLQRDEAAANRVSAKARALVDDVTAMSYDLERGRVDITESGVLGEAYELEDQAVDLNWSVSLCQIGNRVHHTARIKALESKLRLLQLYRLQSRIQVAMRMWNANHFARQ